MISAASRLHLKNNSAEYDFRFAVGSPEVSGRSAFVSAAVGRWFSVASLHGLRCAQRANGLPSKTAVVHSLLAYARESAERTETITDSTGRILGGGIVNRPAARGDSP
eukprot:GHVT01019582.1.p1 GENE.GHVT01019582.1~~GHVT01019582.1.p1  ORF type:complete len:108 (+),score=14.08 GHVT01019582.1:170-493(+)